MGGPARPPFERQPRGAGSERRGPAARPAPREPDISPSDLLAGDEELVAGRRPVEEAFAARRPAIRLLVVPQRRDALERLVLHATALRIPIVEVEGGTLTSLAGFDGHQGVALVVGPRRFATLGDVLARAKQRGEPPFVLVMDSLEDPQNVGTLLRSAEAVGVHGVIYPTHRQAPLSPAAVKASAGAVEHLLLVPVDDLPGTLADLHVQGLRVAGADGTAPLVARQADLRGPLALVVGSEGQGLGPAVRRRCDFLVRIPMRGQVGSLNAAVAGSILLFEVLAQRHPEGAAPGPLDMPGSTPSGTPGDVSTIGPSGRPTLPDPAAGDDTAGETTMAGMVSAGAADAAATAAPKVRRARRRVPDPASDGPDLLPGGPDVTSADERSSAPAPGARGATPRA